MSEQIEPHDVRALSHLLTAAQRSLAVAERLALEPFGLTPAAFRLLDLVALHAGIAPGAAAAALVVKRPTITAWANTLRGLDLLERGGVEGDARRATLTVTAEGDRVARAGRDLIRRRQNRLLAGAVDPVEQAGLLDVLQRIAAAGS
jgi:DNA-binding MarR family transcriptional regulator